MLRSQDPLGGEGLGELGRRLPAEAGVRALGVVVLTPGRERGAGAFRDANRVSFKSSSRRRPSKLSKAFWVGFPGAMQCQSILPSSAKVRMAFEVNSLPLSLTPVWGFPSTSNRIPNSRATLAPDRHVSAISARHSHAQ